MNNKLSIKDIADKLKISKTTVSYIINGKAKQYRISKTLEKRVLDFVDEIKFIPNQVAQSLRTGKTNIIGLIVDDISNDFYADIARCIEEKTFPQGFRLLYCSSENKLSKFKELTKLFRERQVDAYIVAPVTGCEENILSLINENKNLVLFDRYFKTIDTSYVTVQNSEGSYQATNLLIQKLYKHIGFVSLTSRQTVMVDRKAGYLKAMKENRREPIVKEIAFNVHSDVYVEQLISFLEENDQIDALFFSSSVLGVAGLQAIKQLKRKIPEDIAVICFDDHILFRMYSPSITVVAQPIEQIADALIAIVADNDKTTKQIVLPTSLLIRESV